MEQVNHAQAIDQESKKEEAKIETRKKMLELEKLTNQEELNKLDKMKQMGVDLTKVLVAECRNPDKSYRFESGGIKDLKLHMHENNGVEWYCNKQNNVDRLPKSMILQKVQKHSVLFDLAFLQDTCVYDSLSSKPIYICNDKQMINYENQLTLLYFAADMY